MGSLGNALFVGEKSRLPVLGQLKTKRGEQMKTRLAVSSIQQKRQEACVARLCSRRAILIEGNNLLIAPLFDGLANPSAHHHWSFTEAFDHLGAFNVFIGRKKLVVFRDHSFVGCGTATSKDHR